MEEMHKKLGLEINPADGFYIKPSWLYLIKSLIN
jgi:hypothetical protein